jgi:putative pyoverdin transport system ATP-binding/permease protein
MGRLFRMLLPYIGRGGLIKYSFLAILSGVCRFLFVGMINTVVGLLIAGKLSDANNEYIIIFAFVILLFIWVRRVLSLTLINLSQTLFWSLRNQILVLVLNANYEQLSGRKGRLRSAILGDVSVLTNASFNIIDFFTSIILAIALLIYMSTISLVLFAITLCIAIIGVTVYYFTTKANNRMFEQTRKLEVDFQKYFNAILDGFKEIFLEPVKGKAIYENRIAPLATDACERNKSAFTGFLNNQIVGQVLFYILISSVLLIFSQMLQVKPVDTVSFVFALLYLLGSIELIMVLLPTIMRAKVSANHLFDLRTELEKEEHANHLPEEYIAINDFEKLEVSRLEFNYETLTNSFSIGPIDLEIKKSETIFIYGGNGSGKTTFINAVLGLCVPKAGDIRLNGIPVNNSNYSWYRKTFAAVFSDFYLFDELLGIDDIDIKSWHYYLKLFELEGKVKLEGQSFSTTDLSTGQRKRLALVTALMEKKPVLVLDEWAADQDPYFRKKFYTNIIPALKSEGFTIIAITHDDRYYSCADKLYKMEEGQLKEEEISLHQLSTVPL